MDYYLDLKGAWLQYLTKSSSISNKNDSYDLISGFVAYLQEREGITPMTMRVLLLIREEMLLLPQLL